MRLHILSDLHLEFTAFEPPRVEADLVVLAGDIDVGSRAVLWAASGAFGSRPVIYVPGNHEYYKGEMADVMTRLRTAAAATQNVSVLERDELHIDGVRFLGTALWTDFALDGVARRETAMVASADYVLDFRKIHLGDALLTPEATIDLHRDAVAWLDARLGEPFPGTTIVITHHAPHPGSVHPRFAGSAVNPAFVSNLDRLMGRAALWIHGHTHDSFDYVVRGTRIVANPRGYCRNAHRSGQESAVDCENKAFRADLVIEI